MLARSLQSLRRAEDEAQPIIYCPSCRAGYRKPRYETPLFCVRCGEGFDILGCPVYKIDKELV